MAAKAKTSGAASKMSGASNARATRAGARAKPESRARAESRKSDVAPRRTLKAPLPKAAPVARRAAPRKAAPPTAAKPAAKKPAVRKAPTAKKTTALRVARKAPALTAWAPRAAVKGGLPEEEQIEAAKYLLRELPKRLFEEERFVFPETYGITRVRLLVKDPEWLFAHWDVDPKTLASLKAEVGERTLALSRLTLRIADPELGGQKTILLPPGAKSWYVRADARRARAYRAELGMTLPSGEFRALAQSNTVSTPRVGPSPESASERRRVGRAPAPVPGAGSGRAPRSLSGPVPVKAAGKPAAKQAESWAPRPARLDGAHELGKAEAPMASGSSAQAEGGGASDVFRPGGASDVHRR